MDAGKRLGVMFSPLALEGELREVEVALYGAFRGLVVEMEVLCPDCLLREVALRKVREGLMWACESVKTHHKGTEGTKEEEGGGCKSGKQVPGRPGVVYLTAEHRAQVEQRVFEKMAAARDGAPVKMTYEEMAVAKELYGDVGAEGAGIPTPERGNEKEGKILAFDTREEVDVAEDRTYPVSSNAMEICAKRLMRMEGWSAGKYRCPAGALTVGYGHNIDAKGLPDWARLELAEHGALRPESGKNLLVMDVKDAAEDLYGLCPVVGSFTSARQVALLDFVFNVGKGTAGKFVEMWDAIGEGNWAEAGAALLDSKYAKQVGHRARENAKMLVTGVGGGVAADDSDD